MTLSKPGIVIADCQLGRGVFAAQDFVAGEELLQFQGEIISLAQVLEKSGHEGDPLQAGEDTYLDLESPGVYVNHSCTPNSGVKHDRILVALRAIRKGEEIQYDYSTTMGDGGWKMPCRCGSLDCRGVVGDFAALPERLQSSYLKLGVVQRYLAEREKVIS